MVKEQLIQELRGKYRIVTELGSGGSADIWLALAQGPNGFHKLVVLKTLRTELLRDSQLVRLFLDEARLAARLNHPNIVQTNEVFVRAGRPVIVMEYLDGVPMSELLERQRQMGTLSLAMLLRIVSDALGGLHAAHELKDFDGSSLYVVHRDVSPHNLLVTFAGQVKVLDFGIAKFSASGDVTETGVIKGKLRYMPPEQINADPVDRRGDIYSVGVVLWETATGRRMWPDLNEGSIMKRILSGDTPDPRSVNPAISPQLANIIQKALSLDKNDRYLTALDMQVAIEDVISGLGKASRGNQLGHGLSVMFEDLREERARMIERRVAKVVDSLPPEEETPFSVSRQGMPIERPGNRSSNLVLVAAFFFVLAIFGGARVWLRVDPPSEKVTQATTGVAVVAVDKAKRHSTDEVRIRITAFPGEATLLLDGAALISNPHSSMHASNSAEHELTVKAEGYDEAHRRLRFDQDQDVVLTLKKSKEATPALAPASIVRPIAKGRAPSAEPVTSPLSPDPCSTPYFFDERGIKKYKPDCL